MVRTPDDGKVVGPGFISYLGQNVYKSEPTNRVHEAAVDVGRQEVGHGLYGGCSQYCELRHISRSRRFLFYFLRFLAVTQ